MKGTDAAKPADATATGFQNGNGNGEPPPELTAARWRAIGRAMVFVALLMFVYEFAKTAAFPNLTTWESHAITIVFSTFVGTFATWASLRRLDRLHWRLNREQEHRVQLQERSNHLAERATELERMNSLLAREIEGRRQVERQLVHAQKMESIGRLAGGIAHDFNNLLSVIIGGIDLAKAELAAHRDVRPDLDDIRDASMRAARLTRQLLTFARHQPHEPKVTDLHDLIRGALPVIRRLVGETVDVSLNLRAPAAAARVDPAQIEQVVFNLVLNAADAMPGGGKLTLATQGGLADAGTHPLGVGAPWIVLTVSDTGAGIPDEVLPRLFEPFFTTKPVGKGTGLGLATSYGIVSRSLGAIEALNDPAGGAIFRVVLPVVGDAADVLERVTTAEMPVRASATVLLVEDEPAVREVARRLLEGRGYRVLLAGDGEEALVRAGEHGGPIDVLITDVVMPKIGGRALATPLRTRLPDLPVLFMSGYTDVVVIDDSLPNAQFLQKPFTSEILLARVGALVHPKGATRA